MYNICTLINGKGQSVSSSACIWYSRKSITEKATSMFGWLTFDGDEKTEYTKHSSLGTIKLFFRIAVVDIISYTYVNALEKSPVLGMN